DRGRRPRRRLRRPDPPRPRQRAGDRHVDRLRQPPQGRGDQRRPGRRAARRAEPARVGEPAMDIGFGDAVLLFGGLLTVVAALSGLIRGTVLSASVLSVALGIALAATDVVSVDATDQSIVELIEL